MFVTSDEIRITEEMLKKYFQDIKVLNIWKATIRHKKEYKQRLQTKIKFGIQLTDNVKSPTLSFAVPTNRQPPKGLETCIDKAEERYENLLNELETIELDIITAEETIEKLEQDMMIVSEALGALSNESRKILELKLRDAKSFDEIGYLILKSKSAVYKIYQRSICDLYRWLRYITALPQL